MSTIEVAVAGRGIQVKQVYEKPSAGDVNTCEVSLAIESGGVWDSLPHKRVTFATRTASVTVDYAPTIAIPHEVMASPGALYLTLTGYDADGIEVARTHRMTYPIEVARAGADEGAEPSPATLDVVSRIDSLASTLEASETTRQEAFDSAQNERSDAFQASMSQWQQDVAESVSQASIATEKANSAASDANNAATNANEAAVNANETANTIKQRADSGEFNGEPGADGYSPTANVTKEGRTATITVTDKNGTTTATVSDGAPGKDGSDATATDVRIAGKSITADGVADIPIASSSTAGVIKTSTAYATSMSNDVIQIVPAGLSIIDGRTPGGGGVAGHKPIVPNTIDYAVKAAMCDGKGAAWTVEEKLAARERLGLGGDFELIESFTMTQEAQFSRSVTPSGKNYAFKKLFVIAYNEVTTIPAWKAIRPSLDGSSEPLVTIDGLNMTMHMYTLATSEKGYNAIYFDVSRGIFDMSVEAFNSEAYSAKYPTRKTIPKKFNAVTGFTVDSGGFPTGTKINIYGVWA